jgi:hypothetical protein
MVYPLKLRSKLNKMLCQHQSHCTICPIIIIFLFFKKILKNDIFSKNKNKNKILGVAGSPHLAGLIVGSHPMAGWGVAEAPPKRF